MTLKGLYHAGDGTIRRLGGSSVIDCRELEYANFDVEGYTPHELVYRIFTMAESIRIENEGAGMMLEYTIERAEVPLYPSFEEVEAAKLETTLLSAGLRVDVERRPLLKSIEYSIDAYVRVIR